MMDFFKKLLPILFLVLISTTYTFSQDEGVENDKTLKSLQLTKEQKNILKEQLELTKQIRESIKNNLTAEQKRMLANKKLSRAERAKLLRSSLSAKQLDNLKRNQRLLKDKQIRFRRTISSRQMDRLRHFVRDKDIRDRRRLVRRLRRLIRENIDRQ